MIEACLGHKGAGGPRVYQSNGVDWSFGTAS